ncbi:MAG: NADH-quinone oxidoreductase subunit NuoF [Clostridia bacterium]|nr:NADH-quinone oxidoreductase subunit NuoF [Clostridia bacterium]
MKTWAEIESIKDDVNSKVFNSSTLGEYRVLVGLATCGIAAGAVPIYDAFLEMSKDNDKCQTGRVGCVGMCQYEPIVEVYEGNIRTTYVNMDLEKAQRVYKEHILGGKIVEDFLLVENGVRCNSIEDTVFYKLQKRVALRNCGIIDPENIDEYIAKDGYKALHKVVTEMTSDDIIKELLDSGLRGRGGAGFPTGKKWSFAAVQQEKEKFVCCNADEGDPGAFMDRSVLEGDPHALLEAMAIAGKAIGANQGYIYVRAEYPVAVKRLQIAIEEAKEYGFLGDNIFDTDFCFDIGIRLGAGAFVCGEETSLMTSIEGKRGEPRPRPPFPAVKGLFEKPTILNNVETYANIAQIIINGAEWFSSMGTEKSKGTKVFALGGKINNTGLVEVPMGTTLRTIVEKIGGGIPDGKQFKAAQTGGPSGGCIPVEHFDVEIDYDNLIAIGSMMGSGGLIVMDEDNCMVDIAKFFLDFTVDESCGKCTPCRIGTKRLYEILDKITLGEGTMEDLDELEALAKHIKDNSLCGLGQTAPNPVLSTLRYFRNEYESHVKDRKCLSHVCRGLIMFTIGEDRCVGCTKCAKNCPAAAITGEVKKTHVIDQEECLKCGACQQNCAFYAIDKD